MGATSHSGGGSGSGTIVFRVDVLIDHFDGAIGDVQIYDGLKAAAGAFRAGAWDTDDPAGVFDFSSIVDDKYVEEIVVTKVEDYTPPDPMSTLTTRGYACHGYAADLAWRKEMQEDTVTYRIYYDTTPFTDVSDMAPVAEVPASETQFFFQGLLSGVHHYFAITAVDEMLNEDPAVTSVPVQLQVFYESFETGDFSWFPWILSGDAAWIVTDVYPYCGEYAAESPVLDHSESASMMSTVTCEEGDVSFWLSVSSEEGGDSLSFYIDDVLQDAWSGSIGYTQTTHPVTSGDHTFEWTYSKDGENSEGADLARIDMIHFPIPDADDDGVPDDSDECPNDPDPHALKRYYEDGDGDGYGDAYAPLDACEQPLGYVTDGSDCNDNAILEHPGQTWLRDADGDGYSDGEIDDSSCTRPAGYYVGSELTATSGDCDDRDAYEHPDQTWLRDADGDGYSDGETNTSSCSRPVGYYAVSELTATSGDCDDQDAHEHPDQTWLRDLDGDGYSDGGSNNSSCARPAGYYAVSEVTAISGDCDDHDAHEHPGQIWYRDADNDGYSNGETNASSCTRPVGYRVASELTETYGDCKDNDPSIHSESGCPVYVAAGGACGGKRPCHSRIRDAMISAAGGSVVRIAGGTYPENVTVDANAIIECGWDADFISFSQGGPVILSGP